MKKIRIDCKEFLPKMWKNKDKIPLKEGRKKVDALIKSNPNFLDPKFNTFFKIIDGEKNVAYYWLEKCKIKGHFTIISPIILKNYRDQKSVFSIINILERELKKEKAKYVTLGVVIFPSKVISYFEKKGYKIFTSQLKKDLNKKKLPKNIVKFLPMTLGEYRGYKRFMNNYTEMLEIGMNMKKKEAKKQLKVSFKQLAPDGHKDKNNFFLHLVDKKKKKKIGHLWLTKFNFSNKKMMFLSNLYIKKKFRGQGYGKLIMDNIDNFSIKNKMDIIQLNVFSYNKAANNLYYKKGYKRAYINMEKRF